MTLTRKPLFIALITIGTFITGFIFLLKGCLTKYDERFIKPPALVIEKNGKKVIFSIEEFEKTTSYSQKGGMTNKSVSITYSVQTNDGETAELIAVKKLKNHRQVKNFPVEVMGASGTTAWIFMGEPMAFDAFTLDKKADIRILEEKNGSLQGKFPVERKFYSFNRENATIYFTATDGTKWQLNAETLVAGPADYRANEGPFLRRLSVLEKQLKENQVLLNNLYQEKSNGPAKDYDARKISFAEYQKELQAYYNESKGLNKIRDSLLLIQRDLDKNKRKMEDHDRAIKNLERVNPGFSQTKSNQDTASGQWFGLYSDEELEKLNDRVSDQGAYDETVRRKFFSGSYTVTANDYAIINKSSLEDTAPADFLAGGFLLNKETARPIFLPGTQSFLTVHKDKVGREGKILVTSITKEGKINWSYNTNLTQWTDWVFSGTGLYVLGVNNKKLSSDETNILLCINLVTGKAVGYDYFTKKKQE